MSVNRKRWGGNIQQRLEILPRRSHAFQVGWGIRLLTGRVGSLLTIIASSCSHPTQVCLMFMIAFAGGEL